MKKLFIIFIFSLSLPAYGRTYYVSTTGSNTNPGTKDKPFATWDYLATVLVAGDTGFIRGGTYFSKKPTNDKFRNNFSSLTGLPGNPIYIWAYPGETPIFDGSNIPLQNTPILMYINKCNYCHFKGLRVTNTSQPLDKSPVLGWFIYESSHNIIEHCTADHIGGFGFCIGEIQWIKAFLHSTDNLILNCDAYDCSDPLSPSPYDGSNGFNILWTDKAERTTFRGCRAWYNSDDGFDLFMLENTEIYFENCWSFWNGYVNGAPAPGVAVGVGFKLGHNQVLSLDKTMGKVTNCLAVQNTFTGFSSNGRSPIWELCNNTAYDNKEQGFFFTWGFEVHDILKNNVAYHNSNMDNYWGQIAANSTFEVWVQSNNTWNYIGGPCPPFININLSDDDFVSLDASQLVRPRKPDGSLPDIDFMHLMPGSDLIDAGTIVGLPYVGNAPDLGAFEFSLKGSAAIPEYVSSLIKPESPSSIEITFNLNLDFSKVPSPGDFSVTVNSETRNIVSVLVEQSIVKLMLTEPLEGSDQVFVSYNKPAVNYLQTVYGGESASFTNEKVVNKIQILKNVPAVSASIYPNPAHDYIEISLEGEPRSQRLFIRFYNLSGTFLSEDYMDSGTTKTRIPFNLLPGIYVIQIGFGVITFLTQKLIVFK